MGNEHHLWFGKVPLDVRIEGLLWYDQTLRLRALGMGGHAIRLR